MGEPNNESRWLGAEASRLLIRRGYVRLQIEFNSPDKVVKGHRNALQERRQEKTTPSRRRSSGQAHSHRRLMNAQDSPTKPKQDVPSFARIDSVLEHDGPTKLKQDVPSFARIDSVLEHDGPTKLKQDVPSFARTDSVLEQEDCTTSPIVSEPEQPNLCMEPQQLHINAPQPTKIGGIDPGWLTTPNLPPADDIPTLNGHGRHTWTTDIAPHVSLPLNTIDDPRSSDGTAQFISRQRRCLLEGWSVDTVFGTTEIDLDSVFTVQDFQMQPATVSQWVASFLRASDVLGVPERLGLMLLFGRLIRWQISPCTETYAKVPDFLRPTRTQLHVIHPSWIDFVLWPDIRDAFILDPETHNNLQQVVQPVSGFLSANWLQSPAQILGSETVCGDYALSPQFDDHVSMLANWTLDADAAMYCPILSSKVR